MNHSLFPLLLRCLRGLACAGLAGLLLGCSSIYHQQQLALHPFANNDIHAHANADARAVTPAAEATPQPVGTPICAAPSAPGPKKIAIFFDGTHNDTASDTNVKRLHALVSLQARCDIATLYMEGVGVGSDILGAGTGVGFHSRVVLAYHFLRTHYRAGDEIYLFGFSRGAFQARALASMLQYIGLPDAPDALEGARSFGQQIHAAEHLFDAMKRGFGQGVAPQTIAALRSDPVKPYRSRRVRTLGLWDTVEALGGGLTGWPERLAHKAGWSAFDVNVDEPNPRYGDQLHNVDTVLHAVALDDNREWIFTPLLLSRQHLLAPKSLPGVQAGDTKPGAVVPPAAHPHIMEVWFAGAHSDVGGGYADSDLSGVSLNWMIAMLAHTDAKLLPAGAAVRQDVHGTSHNPEAGKWSAIYHDTQRNIATYALGNTAACALAHAPSLCKDQRLREPLPEFAGRLCVHPSVFQRRAAMQPKAHENRYLHLDQPGTVCVAARKDLANPPILEQHSTLQDARAQCPVGTLPLRIEQWTPQGCTTETQRFTLRDQP